nr:NADH dehydrogenase subunit 4L [Platydemus manokwari]
MTSSVFFDLFIVVFFVFHLFFLYYYYFRLLKFLLSVEVSLVLVFFFSCIIILKCEIAFLLILLSIIVCESAIGLVLLVGFVRFNENNNVKNNLFGCF